MDKSDLAGRVGLVTGGGAGIGEACALQLAKKNAVVLVSDIDLAAAQKVVAKIESEGGRALANQCDVSSPSEVAAMVCTAVEALGGLDFAVNNAGILGSHAQVHRYELADWNRVMAVNLNGVFHCMQEELRVFYPQRRGAIVNIASEAALKGSAADSAYTASKHAVAGLTKTAALEAIHRNVRINAVCPGSIETPLIANLANTAPKLYEQAKNLMPIARMGQPSEIAEAVAWLCSDAASLMVGHLMAVDGGWAIC